MYKTKRNTGEKGKNPRGEKIVFPKNAKKKSVYRNKRKRKKSY